MVLFIIVIIVRDVVMGEGIVVGVVVIDVVAVAIITVVIIVCECENV